MHPGGPPARRERRDDRRSFPVRLRRAEWTRTSPWIPHRSDGRAAHAEARCLQRLGVPASPRRHLARVARPRAVARDRGARLAAEGDALGRALSRAPRSGTRRLLVLLG